MSTDRTLWIFPPILEDLDEDLPEVAGPAFADELLDDGPSAGDAGIFPPDAEDLSELRPVGVYEEGNARLHYQLQTGGVLQQAQCSGCGCTDALPCPGGCFWANASATLCSRCALRGGAS